MTLSLLACGRGRLLSACLASVLTLVGVLTQTPAYAADACDAAQKTALPGADLPDAHASQVLSGCDAEALYYGFGKAVDFPRARQCAYLQRSKNDASNGPFQGAAILTMLYANGQGVARNLPLAQKFACEAGGAPAEIESRSQHLATLAAAPAKTDFDFCDDITSGYMQGFCADRDARFRSAKRSQQLADMVGHWNHAKQNAFAPLQNAAQHFFETRVDAEVDRSGTGRAAFMIEENGKLNDELVNALNDFERGKLPAYTHHDAVAADQQLNQVYTRALKVLGNAPQDGSVTAEGVRATQRAWLTYRDAWVKFGAQAYPKVTADSWATWATEQRTHQLRDFTDQD